LGTIFTAVTVSCGVVTHGRDSKANNDVPTQEFRRQDPVQGPSQKNPRVASPWGKGRSFQENWWVF